MTLCFSALFRLWSFVLPEGDLRMGNPSAQPGEEEMVVRRLGKAQGSWEKLILCLSGASKGWVWGVKARCGRGGHVRCLHCDLQKMAAAPPGPKAEGSRAKGCWAPAPVIPNTLRGRRDQAPHQVSTVNNKKCLFSSRFYWGGRGVQVKIPTSRLGAERAGCTVAAPQLSSHTNSGRPHGSGAWWILCPPSAERKLVAVRY